ICRTVDSIYSENSLETIFLYGLAPSFSQNSCASLYFIGPFTNRGKACHFRQMTRPPLALPPSGLPFLPMLPRRRPTTLRACGVFARRSLPVVPSSPLAVWAG